MCIDHFFWDYLDCQDGTNPLIWDDFHVTHQTEYKALGTHDLSAILKHKSYVYGLMIWSLPVCDLL